MTATGAAHKQFRLLYLDGISSQELLDMDQLVCPLCGAPAQPAYLRAGLTSFVAALVCVQCHSITRASDAFFLDDA